jgi:microcystin-dependent protein
MSLIIGTILSVCFDASTTPEQGFLPCDGSAVDRTTYADLFSAIGTQWGAGDGSKTFNLPDLRGLFVRGVDDGANADPDVSNRTFIAPGGSKGNNPGSIEFYATALSSLGPLSTSTNGKHQHNVPHLPIDSSWYQIAGSHYGQWNSGGTASSNDGLHNHTIAKGGDNETRPVNVYVDYIVYTGVLN